MALETIFPILAEPFIQYVVTPAARHVSYAFRCNSKVETLQNQVGKLKNKRLERQQLVDDATRNGEEIFPAVTEWLTAAEKEIEDAEQLIQGKAQAMNKCFVGLCPNFKTRYQLSKKAHKKALAVCEKLQEAQEAGSDPISFRLPLQQIIEPSLYSSEALPSRVLILNQIMDALRDPKLNVIGVYGMGGIGKTTLAKEVKGKATQEKMLFKTVVLVAVSQTPDVRRIQGEIADSLGLRFDVEEIPGRASRLHKRLEEEKVLIILDDVWQRLDLSAVGVPSRDGCKIFITSRRKDVLRNEMHTQKEFSLDALEEKETWSLFAMSVSDVTNPELHRMAAEIAKKCAGLPLLILKVAADLRDKPSYAWNDMLNRLSSLENTEIYEKVHRVIESSYDKLLDEEAKSLFLLCALFGDSNVGIHKLVMYSVGLGLFKRIGTIDGARNRVLSLIDKLKNECLLLDGDTAGFVKIHDVVREIAVVIASRAQNAFVGAGEVRSVDFQNSDCTRISFPHCDICELPQVVECPKAEVFSLNANDDRLDISGSFLEGCPKLKVVDFTGVHFESGLSLGFLGGLRTLCLERCWFRNVAIVAQLKQLEVLSFAGSYIEELPREIKELTRLRILDLRRCKLLRVIPANVLSNLSLLEELYILKSFAEWEADGNASLVELKNLSHLKTLEIQVLDEKLLPEDWFFNEVQNYRISIGYWHWRKHEYETARRILKLVLQTSSGLVHKIKEFVKGTEVLLLHDVKGAENLLNDSPYQASFFNLTTLVVVNCTSLKYAFTNSMVKSLKQLEYLEICECKSMEEIIQSEEENINVAVFPKLSFLKLESLQKLKRFGSGCPFDFPSLKVLQIKFCTAVENMVTEFPNRSNNTETEDKCIFFNNLVSVPNLEEMHIHEMNQLIYLWSEDTNLDFAFNFKNLKTITIAKCPDLECVFPASVARGTLQIQRLEIVECGVEAIIANAKCETVEWPNLTQLVISECHNMIGISSNNSKVIFSNIEQVFITGAEKLRYIWNEDISVDSSFSLNSLLSVHVSRCPDLKYVFPACGFLQLQELRIEQCGVEEIIRMAKDESIECPNLTRMVVDGCKRLKYVFTSSMLESLKKLQMLKIRGCELIEEIVLNEDTEEENMKTIDLPELSSFRLQNLPNLKKLSRTHVLNLPSVSEYDMSGCTAMENLFSKFMERHREEFNKYANGEVSWSDIQHLIARFMSSDIC